MVMLLSRPFAGRLLSSMLGVLAAMLVGLTMPHFSPAEEDGPAAAPMEGPLLQLQAQTQPSLVGTGTEKGAQLGLVSPAATDGLLQRLADYGITPEQIAAHADGRPLEGEPQTVELLMKLLFRLDLLPPGKLQQWALSGKDLATLSSARSGSRRGLCFSANGRVQRVQEIKFQTRDAERWQFRSYYRCNCVADPANTPLVVYARSVPAAWLKDDKLNERIQVTGIYLGRGSAVGAEDSLLMVAPRLAWHADTLLGDLGVDVGLLSNVTDGGPISAAESELFYQMLAAVERTGVVESRRNARRELKQRYRELLDLRREGTERELELKRRVASAAPHSEELADARSELQRNSEKIARLNFQVERVESGASELLPMLEEPKQQRGQLKLIRCLARRIVDVKITDPDIRRRYGMDHYFQIDALATLELTVRIHTRQAIQDGKVIYDTKEAWSYPVTFCVRSLPEGLSTGEQLHEEIAVPAFFFKNWSYDTSDLEGNASARRVAPLLIAREPIRLLPPPTGSATLAGVLSGVLFAVVVLGIWVAVWLAHRADRKFQGRLLGIGGGSEGTVSLNELNIQEASQPNFRHLSQPAKGTTDAEEGASSSRDS